MSFSRALDVLLPRRCLLCRGRATAGLCDGCDADLPAIVEACDRCGIPLADPWQDCAAATALAQVTERDGGSRLCASCIRRPPPFDCTVAALDYVFPVTVLVQRFKFNRSLACGAVLSDWLLAAVMASMAGPGKAADLIVPVPLHPVRLFFRAFNQAEVLARDIGRSLGIPVLPRGLRRQRRTPAQMGLSAHERRRNLKGAFTARPMTGLNVALVDDVMTTGATVGECARALKRAGASSVSVWVAARAL